ncbi:hypothetical protein EK21DRAFT_95003 [Setomelanomma holmii]|uniref:Uncharacterized protein n=1 Tax=Setomelanomma holmii TaxID=210430 RepID=A0A9P4LEJ4_9PLEO|nr:hypothetical protein EK21DRAFT_95003 [Setomelanomma holmii]
MSTTPYAQVCYILLVMVGGNVRDEWKFTAAANAGVSGGVGVRVMLIVLSSTRKFFVFIVVDLVNSIFRIYSVAFASAAAQSPQSSGTTTFGHVQFCCLLLPPLLRSRP